VRVQEKLKLNEVRIFLLYLKTYEYEIQYNMLYGTIFPERIHRNMTLSWVKINIHVLTNK